MDVLDLIGVAAFVLTFVALIGVIKPIKAIGLPTRKRAALIGLIAFVTSGICAVNSPSHKQPTEVAAVTNGASAATTSPVTAQVSDPTPVAVQTAAAPPLPADESSFVAAINKGRDGFRAAANEMAQGGIRAQRKTAVCAALASSKGIIKDWVGQVSTLSSNSDGKGILAVTLADGLTVTTHNNDLSDIDQKTLIDPSSALFQKASALKQGQSVFFSGGFFKSSTDCAAEQSMTLEGSMTEPAYTFRFSDVRSAD